MLTLEVNADYGYVVFVFVASIVLLQWLGFKVAVARKKYGIKVGRTNYYLNNATQKVTFWVFIDYKMYLYVWSF